jgi:homoserine kinase
LKSYVKVSAPTTIANFGPGFDTFGLALNEPRDIIELTMDVYETEIQTIPDYSIPTKKNAAFAAANSIAWKNRVNAPFHMKITKGARPGSGIGSSAASSVGAALAMAIAMDYDAKDEDIIQASSLGEKMASGTPHIDNVTASLLGGFTIVSSRNPIEVISVPPDKLPKFNIVVTLPDVVIETRKSRGVLPKSVPLTSAVENISLCSTIVHAMMSRDVERVGRFLNDEIVLPYRKVLMPWFDKVKKAAIDAGALGFSISGAGPAVFAICTGKEKDITAAIEGAFKSAGFKSQSFITNPGKGAEVLAVR